MYEIIAMSNTGKESVIYNDKANNTEFKVENPKLTMAEDTAGSLTFKMPPTHPNYDALDLMSTLIRVHRDGECVWAGRITEQKIDMWDQKDVTCEGVLGYLNDTVQEPYLLKDTVAYSPKKILELIVNRHNEQIKKATGGVGTLHKTFTVGTVNVYEGSDVLTPDDEDTNWYTDWNTSWDALNQLLFGRYPKGHLRCQWRHDTTDEYSYPTWHLDYLSQEYYTTSTQTIEFGKNLIDFTRSYNVTELKTVCLPRGAVLEDKGEYIDGLNRRLGVTTVNNTANGEISDFNDQFIRITQAVSGSTALSDMGWIVQEVVWDEVTDKTKLKNRAKKWLRDEQFDNMQIELQAVDLHYLNSEIKSVDVLTKIHCISKPHGMDRYFPVTKIEITIDRPESSKIYLGSSKQRSFSGSTVGKNSKTDKEISDIWKKLDNFEIGPVEAEIPSWSTSSWDVIFRALLAHYSGAIDLEVDYGWRVGDTRKIWLNGGYTSDPYDAYRNQNNAVTYTIPAGWYDLTLLQKGRKKVLYSPIKLIEGQNDNYTNYDVDTSYDFYYQEQTSKQQQRECAFVVGITGGWPSDAYGFGRDYIGGVSSRYWGRYDNVPMGLPYDQLDRCTETQFNNNLSPGERWGNCWLHKFLTERVYYAIAMSDNPIDYGETVGLKAHRGYCKNKTLIMSENIFKPIVTSYLSTVEALPSLNQGGVTLPTHPDGDSYATAYKMSFTNLMNYKTVLTDRITIPTLSEIKGHQFSNFVVRIVDTDEDSLYSSWAIPYDFDTLDEIDASPFRYVSKSSVFNRPIWTRTTANRTPYSNASIRFTDMMVSGGNALGTDPYPYRVDKSLYTTSQNEWDSSFGGAYLQYPFLIPILCI